MNKVQWFDRTVSGWHLYNDGVMVDTKFVADKDEKGFDGVEVVKVQPDREMGLSGRLKRKNYLSNKELMKELLISQEQGKMTDKFAQMMMLLTHRISRKANFASYSYIDEMRNSALTTLCEAFMKFNPEKSENVFAYMSQCVHMSFISVLNKEKKQQNARDKLLMIEGQLPSFSYQEKWAEEHHKDHYKEKDTDDQ